jgi:hypothetical protein
MFARASVLWNLLPYLVVNTVLTPEPLLPPWHISGSISHCTAPHFIPSHTEIYISGCIHLESGDLVTLLYAWMLETSQCVTAKPQKLIPHIDTDHEYAGQVSAMHCYTLDVRVLTLNQPGCHLNFSTWIMKNVSFELKRIKLWNKLHFEENETDSELS